MKKTILITGASRGFGKIWAEAFLKRGDHVIATARNIASLKGLTDTYGSAVLPLELDVTNRAQTFDVLGKAHAHFGVLDVVINNAGYGLFGTIEEATEQEARDQFEANVFGTLWVSQAAIPLMRKQGHGHIIQVSSVLGIASIPNLGLYNASKWAVEAMSEAMATEVKHFGIHTTLVEPIGYSTDWSGASAAHSKPIGAYDQLREVVYEEMKNMDFGNPDATASAILKVVDAEVPPLRIFFGKTALPWINQVYADRLRQWEEWNEVSVAAHG